MGLIPGWGRPPGAGNGTPLQYSCLENSTDRGAWQSTVDGHSLATKQEQPPLLSVNSVLSRALTLLGNSHHYPSLARETDTSYALTIAHHPRPSPCELLFYIPNFCLYELNQKKPARWPWVVPLRPEEGGAGCLGSSSILHLIFPS